MRQTRLTLALAAAVAAAAVLPSSMAFAADEGVVAASPALPADALPAPAVTEPTRLLVLPFAPLADADRDAWIGRAISDALTADLSIDRALSVSTDKQSAADGLAAAVDAGRAAGADRVVFGSFQKVEGEIRITGQIADVAKGEPIAGLKATGPLQELFTLQDSLAHQIQIRLGRPGLPAAPPTAPLQPADAEQPFARDDRDDDGVLGVPRPEAGREIGWLNGNGPAGDLADARRIGRDRFVYNLPAPVYSPSFYNPYYAGVGYGYGFGFGYDCYRPRPVHYGGYYPAVTATVTHSDGDGWDGRPQTPGNGIVGGGMRATPKYQPYQGVTAPRMPQRSNAPTQASTMQVGNRRMYGAPPPGSPAPTAAPAPAASPTPAVERQANSKPNNAARQPQPARR